MLKRGTYSTRLWPLLALLACGSSAYAQDNPNPQPAATSPPPQAQSPAPESQKPSAPAAKQDASRDENPKRILGIIPNFQTTNDLPENQKPLTPKEKYILAFHQTVDISAHFGNLFQSALQQASNGEPHYGQGWGAYASRFGASE